MFKLVDADTAPVHGSVVGHHSSLRAKNSHLFAWIKRQRKA